MNETTTHKSRWTKLRERFRKEEATEPIDGHEEAPIPGFECYLVFGDMPEGGPFDIPVDPAGYDAMARACGWETLS